jgi:hypothetical protein
MEKRRDQKKEETKKKHKSIKQAFLHAKALFLVIQCNWI